MTSTFRVLATAIVVAVLVAGNVLTLTNHRFQSKLHDWLSASVGSMIDMTGSTINQARAVEKENGRLRVEKQQLVVAMATLTATVAALQAANEILGYQNKTLASSIKTAEQGNIKRLMASRSLIAKVFPRVVAGAVIGRSTGHAAVDTGAKNHFLVAVASKCWPPVRDMRKVGQSIVMVASVDFALLGATARA